MKGFNQGEHFRKIIICSLVTYNRILLNECSGWSEMHFTTVKKIITFALVQCLLC